MIAQCEFDRSRLPSCRGSRPPAPSTRLGQEGCSLSQRTCAVHCKARKAGAREHSCLRSGQNCKTTVSQSHVEHCFSEMERRRCSGRKPGYYSLLAKRTTASVEAFKATQSKRRWRTSDEDCFEVECILSKRRRKGVSQFGIGKTTRHSLRDILFLPQVDQYLVHWYGYSRYDASWLPSSQVSSSLVE